MIHADRILVTRFAPYAAELASELTQANCFAIAQPLCEVVALKEPLSLQMFLKGHYDMVIAVSGHAVTFAQRHIGKLWPKATYIAVGASTQKSLSVATQQYVYAPSSRFDSEGVLSLDVLQSIKNKNILILRGEGGRALIEDTLFMRGAHVDFFQTYKRIMIKFDVAKLINNWQSASINGAIISSNDILNQLFNLVPAEHSAWLKKIILYVPSQRVAKQALALGAKYVVVLPSLHTAEIVAFFQQNNGKIISPYRG